MNHIEKEVYQLQELKELAEEIDRIVETLDARGIYPWDKLWYFQRDLKIRVHRLEEVMRMRPDVYGPYLD